MKRTAIILTAISVALLNGCASSAPSPAQAPDIAPPSPNRISTIQGRAHTSPLDGKQVDGVKGIVTAVVKGRTPGFWMQDATGDDDPATSDGIFVALGEKPVDVAVGDAVSVSGAVTESGREGSLTTTTIASPDVVVESHGNDLPQAVFVGRKGRWIPMSIATDEMRKYDPSRAAIDFWESLEGMRVEIHDLVVVGPTTRYGEIVVLPDNGTGARIRSMRGGVVVQEGSFNPQRIVLDPRLAGPSPEVNVGDHFEGKVTGIIDYAFNNYRFIYTEALPSVESDPMAPEVTSLEGDDSHLTIATYNVLNLGAPSPDERFLDVAKSIVDNLRAPDVIALQEIQDDSGPEDDGVVSAAKTFSKLIESIVASGGPRYDYREIDPLDKHDGGQPGGNIRVGLLFNPERVRFVDRGKAGPEDPTKVVSVSGLAGLTLSPGRVDPTNPCFAGGGEGELAEPTRKSLAAELTFGEDRFFVVVNHLKSKRGDDALFGPRQPPKRPTEEQRTCQAEVIGRFAADILKEDTNARVVVLGDFNENEFRSPLAKLVEASGLTNLMEWIVVADRYTYVFEGNAQVLDNLLVSPSLLKNAEIDIVHANADRVESEAASDHDPVVARLEMR